MALHGIEIIGKNLKTYHIVMLFLNNTGKVIISHPLFETVEYEYVMTGLTGDCGKISEPEARHHNIGTVDGINEKYFHIILLRSIVGEAPYKVK